MQNIHNTQTIHNTKTIQDTTTDTTIKQIVCHEIVVIMTHMMNYLSVSLYESQFTKNHEDAYAMLKSIYDSVALHHSVAPSLKDVAQFYENIVYLGSVTYTDDPDYYTYKRGLRKYFININIK
jgi:hypothetical protein